MKKGFTIVELALVLVVIGVIISLSLQTFLTNLSKQNDNEREERALVTISEGLINQASTNKIMPTQDIFDDVAINYSTEPHVFRQEFILIDFNYFHDNSTGNICSFASTDRSLRICENASCTDFETIDNISFAIYAGGNNRFLETKIENENTLVYYNDSSSDDTIKYITLAELRSLSGCPSLEILTTSIPTISKTASATGDTVIQFIASSQDADSELRWCYSTHDDTILNNGSVSNLVLAARITNNTSARIPPCTGDPFDSTAAETPYLFATSQVNAESGTYRLSLTAYDINSNQTDTKDYILNIIE